MWHCTILCSYPYEIISRQYKRSVTVGILSIITYMCHVYILNIMLKQLIWYRPLSSGNNTQRSFV